MRLATMAGCAALALALSMGVDMPEAHAGKKGKQGHGGSGNVHISPGVSSKNLHKLKGKLPQGSTRHAVDKELKRRQQIIDEAHMSKGLGKIIGDGGAGAQTILDIGLFGTSLGKRKGGH